MDKDNKNIGFNQIVNNIEKNNQQLFSNNENNIFSDNKTEMVNVNSINNVYQSNNKQYIIEKINTLFGYNAVLNLYIKEIPTIIKKKQVKKNIVKKDVKLCIDVKSEELRKVLVELGESL